MFPIINMIVYTLLLCCFCCFLLPNVATSISSPYSSSASALSFLSSTPRSVDASQQESSSSLSSPLLLQPFSKVAAATTTTTTRRRTIKVENNYKNIVLEGGGAKGISYIGAFKSFESHGLFKDGRYTFENITGNSVGCLFGLIIALDIDPLDAERLVLASNLDRELFDFSVQDALNFPVDTDGWWQYTKDIVSYFFDLTLAWNNANSPGLSGAEKYVDWLNDKLLPLSPHKDKLSGGRFTFEQLRDVTGHNLNCPASRLEVASVSRMNADVTPNMIVYDATYVSGCLPVVRKPVIDQFGCTVVDGGIYDNFPIYEYDYNDERSPYTLGVSLNMALKEHDISRQCKTTSLPPPPPSSSSSLRYADISTKQLVILMIEASFGYKDVMAYSNDERNDGRVIYLNSTLNVIQFDATKEEKQNAIDTALKLTDLFFDQ